MSTSAQTGKPFTQGQDDKELEDINLLNAIRTVFSVDGDKEKFLSRADDEIRKVENEIIGTCANHRIRLEDNLHTLLESRDGISEQVNDLNRTSRTVDDMTTSVDNRMKEIYTKQQIRQNLDDALKIAMRTRQLTRLYARVEQVLNKSNNINSALQMYKVLEREMKKYSAELILQDIIPNPNVLRQKIVDKVIHQHFLTWFSTVESYESALGAYALDHATSQMSSLQFPKGPLGQPFDLLPLLNSPSALTSNNTSNNHPRIHHPPTHPWRPSLLQTHTINALLSSEQGEQPPQLYLRPLLQAIHAAHDLDLLTHMCAEYESRRAARLRHILNEYDDVNISQSANGNETTETEQSTSSPECSFQSTERVEALVAMVAGFFVVERSVELHVQHLLVSHEVVDEDWWTLAYAKLLSIFKAFDESSNNSNTTIFNNSNADEHSDGKRQLSDDHVSNVDDSKEVMDTTNTATQQRKRVSFAEARLERFAEVNGFLS